MAATQRGHPGGRPFPLGRDGPLWLPQIWVALCSVLHPLCQAGPGSPSGSHILSALPTAGPDVRGTELSGFPFPASLPTALLIQD